MSHSPQILLRHILVCIALVEQYTTGGEDEFFVDGKTRDAVIRNLEIIGQAVKDIGVEQLVAAEPSISWRDIGDLRNVLAHQYLGVDARLVWNIVVIELPRLKPVIETLVASMH